MRKSLNKLAFAAVVAGALGFGGTQAFASPGTGEAGKASCVRIQCHQSCRAVCGSSCYGYCNGDICMCEYI